MKFFLTLARIACLCSIAQIATVPVDANALSWRWSHPVSHGNNISDLVQWDGRYIQVTDRGQLYSSTDLRNWQRHQTSTLWSLRSATVFQGSIVVVGENGTVVWGRAPERLQTRSLRTGDWLEGVAASPTRVVAVGDNSAVYTSDDLVTWTRQTVPFNDWIRAIAYGIPDGTGLFVAVGEDGLVASSPDGIAWTARTRRTALDLNRVAWVDGQFVAVGAAGAVLSSSNGVTWVTVATGAVQDLNAVAGHTGSILVAGAGEVRLRENRTWSNPMTNSLAPPVWTYLSALWDGTAYLLGGRTGVLVDGFKTSSTNPYFWVPMDDSPREWLWDVAPFSELYVAVGDRGTILTSEMGRSWDQEVPPASLANSIFLGVGGRTNLAVAVGSAGAIMISPDTLYTTVRTNASGTLTTNQTSSLGIVWSAVEPRPATEDLQGVTTFDDTIVVSGGSGLILTSLEGRTWTRRTSPTTNFLSSVTSFPGGVVAAGRGGTLLFSPDLANWSARASGTSEWIYRVRHLNGTLVAVGQGGLILTSVDGLNWTPRPSGSTRWLTDVTWTGTRYVVIGAQGTVLTSPDLVRWSDVGTITGKSLYGLARLDNQIVAVGVEGVILRARADEALSRVQIVQFPQTASETVFLFSGEPDQAFRLDRSTDLIEWKAGPHLELWDEDGTLIIVDDEANAPEFQFFRALPLP